MNLYEFTGRDPTRYLTNNKTSVTVATQTYAPLAIRRSAYRLDPLKVRSNMTIIFPGDDTWARELTHPNDYRLEVAVKTMTGTVFWRGKLLSVSVKPDRKIELIFRPFETVKGTLGERRIFQFHCPFVLYGDRCGATKTFLTADVIEQFPADRKKVVVNLQDIVRDGELRRAGEQSSNPFLGGLFRSMVSGSSEDRWIVGAVYQTDGVQLTFVDDLPMLGSTVEIATGCNRTVSHCALVHENLRRFGGFWSMRTSPFDGAIRG